MALGDIILLKDKTPRGPFTRAQIQEGLSRGEFDGHDLAHTPGLRNWLPLDEVLHHLDHDVVKTSRTPGPRQLPPLPGSIAAPPELPAIPIRKELPPELPEKKAPAAPPDLPAAVLTMREDLFEPAPIGQRFLAWVIDWAVLFVPVLVLFGFAYLVTTAEGAWERQDAETLRQEHALLWRNLRDLLLLVALGFGWLYGAGLESSRWQATVGKQWMGLIVTDGAGERMTFLRASARHAAKYLSALPCFFGFITALFNPLHLAWHDRLAETRVARK
jgi:uncharacterized RDD family membrane protein YckC